MAAADQLGIDVAGYQHPQGTSINWSAVKKDGVRFAFIKATEATNYTNPYLAGDWAATRSVGIYHGAYHFARPSVGSAAAQARYFVSKAGLANKAGDLPPVLDLEKTGGLGVRALRTWVTNWLDTVQNLTGRKPIIYTAPYFWSTYMGGSTAFGSYRLWIANYGVSSPQVPKGWSTWTFWQGNSTGKVPGISGSVDMDSFNGTLAQLAALANASGSASGAGSTQQTTTAVATTVTLATSRAGAYRGQSVKLSGSLATSTGTALASQRVVLRYRPQGQVAWTRIGSLPTDSSGHFAVTAKVMAATRYQVVFPGTAKYARSVSAVRSVAITPKTVTSLRLAADRTSVSTGSRVKLYGSLTTADGTPLVGRQVRYFVRPSGASTGWTLIGSTTTTAPTGWFQQYVTPSKSSTYKVVYPGGLKYTRATSNWVTVSVH